jgi:hypothetical protein
LHIVPRIEYLGLPTRGKKCPLTTTGDLSACKSKRTLIQPLTVNIRLCQDNRGRHKLSPSWEGPYVVVKVLKPGTYKLANEDGEKLTNAWNIQQLRRFYP